MVDAIIAGVVLLAVVVGLWLTRNAKGRGGPPGMPAKDALLDAQLKPLEHDEAFEDQKPLDR
jgi:hypothetical protein